MSNGIELAWEGGAEEGEPSAACMATMLREPPCASARRSKHNDATCRTLTSSTHAKAASLHTVYRTEFRIFRGRRGEGEPASLITMFHSWACSVLAVPAGICW